jgi:hypothetical protein
MITYVSWCMWNNILTITWIWHVFCHGMCVIKSSNTIPMIHAGALEDREGLQGRCDPHHHRYIWCYDKLDIIFWECIHIYLCMHTSIYMYIYVHLYRYTHIYIEYSWTTHLIIHILPPSGPSLCTQLSAAALLNFSKYPAFYDQVLIKWNIHILCSISIHMHVYLCIHKYIYLHSFTYRVFFLMNW